MRFKWLIPIVLAAAAQAAVTSSIQCVTSGTPVMVRSEGLTEELGDILLHCTGGIPNGTVLGSLSVSLPVSITNRVTTGSVIDAVLTADAGGGPVSTGATPVLGGANTVTFTGVNLTLSATGSASLRISRLRVAAAQLGADNPRPIVATLSWVNGGTAMFFDRPTASIGIPFRGLYAGTVSALVNCHGSALPEEISLANLFAAGTALSATRVSEGFAAGFLARRPGQDSGTRLLLRYTGFPADARLFVPDAIAGSTAAAPTTSGLLGGAPSGGAYAPGSGALLLVRIVNVKADGSGGAPLYTPGAPGSGAAALDRASEVQLVNGAAQVVYEVADSNPTAPESAEIPTWLGLPPTGGATAAPNQSVTYAPLSDVVIATEDDPVPRFTDVQPEPDCTLRGDCSAFPKLSVTAPPLEYTAPAGSPRVGTWISVNNASGGYLSWTYYVTYKNGTGWASLAFTPGRRGGGKVKLMVAPAKLEPGIYEATVTIDAGPIGLENLPVKLTVIGPPSPDPLAPQVNAVVHAATLASGPVVPGSLAAIQGLRLEGGSVSVAFDSTSVTPLSMTAQQLVVEVPAALADKTATQMVVTVDGRASAPLAVNLTPIAPGIFANGILNQDNTLNSAEHPASGNTVIQVFATGLPASSVATVTAKIHDVWISAPEYAGPAPGYPGLQQVNLRLPSGWPSMTTSVVLCGTSIATGVRTCGPEAPLNVQ